MTGLYLKLNPSFADADKEKCKPTIYRLIELANLSRSKGVLALEAEMQQEPSFFLKTAIRLVIDGTMPELVKQILQTLILADGYSGFQLLNRLIMAEGVLLLQQGENPRVIATILGAMLGEKYVSQINEELSDMESSPQGHYKLLNALRANTPLSESAYFESKLLRFHNNSIQRILRGIDFNVLLAALRGCGPDLAEKIADNISVRMCLTLANEWSSSAPPPKECILRCQKEILEKITALEKSGEIIEAS